MDSLKLGGFIIGAPKAGTSAATVGLSNHPLIGRQTLREMNYFQHDDLYEAGWDAAYARFFEVGPKTQTLLGKNVGVLYSEHALERLHAHNPNVKVFVFLRNPIARAYSAYHFARRQGWETCESFEEALDAPRERLAGTIHAQTGGMDYLGRGLYAQHLEKAFTIFPRENISVYFSEDLRTNMTAILRGMAEAICGEGVAGWTANTNRTNESQAAKNQTVARMVTRQFPGRRLLKRLIPGRARDQMRASVQKANSVAFTPPPLSDETRTRLRDYYRAPNQKLETLLGIDLAHWSD